MEIEQPGTELLPLSRRVPSRSVPSAQPRRRRGLHRHEDLPVPAPHHAALHTTKRPADELLPEENGKPGPRADLDEALSHPYLLRPPAGGTGIGGDVEEELLRGVPPPPAAASVHRPCRRKRGGERATPCGGEKAEGDWWRRGQREAEERLLLD